VLAVVGLPLRVFRASSVLALQAVVFVKVQCPTVFRGGATRAQQAAGAGGA
jgi:hypothetical protein